MRMLHVWISCVAVQFLVTSSVEAGVILQPAAATTSMGQAGASVPAHVRDQSGLVPPYVNGVTDFPTYIAGNPTHFSADQLSNDWVSASGNTTGNFDFDLGGSFVIGSMALWNIGSSAPLNLRDFTLLADDNSLFTSPTVLGSYTANSNTGPSTAVLPEVFSFTPASASFVRMQITSNYGNPLQVGFGEAAFEEAELIPAIPEPASLWLLGFTGVLIARSTAQRLRKRRTRTQ